ADSVETGPADGVLIAGPFVVLVDVVAADDLAVDEANLQPLVEHIGEPSPLSHQDVSTGNLFVFLKLVVLIDHPVEIDAGVSAGHLVGELSAGAIAVAKRGSVAVVGVGGSAVAQRDLELAQEREAGLAIRSAVIGVIGVEFGVGVFIADRRDQL